jgi:hypothetical protein
MRNEFVSYKPILCLGVLSFLTFILRKEMSEERALICMVAMSIHLKSIENLLLVHDTKYSHNQKVLISKAGQEWYIRQQRSV